MSVGTPRTTTRRRLIPARLDFFHPFFNIRAHPRNILTEPAWFAEGVHDNIVLDPHPDATELRWDGKIIGAEVEAGFDCENHSLFQKAILVHFLTCLGAVVNVDSQVVACSMGHPPAVLLALR